MKKLLEIIGAFLGWFAIITQLVLMLQHQTKGVGATLFLFFSFFTIITNLLVAVFFSVKALRLSEKRFKLFYAAGTITALAVYILIVGFVYQVALRHIWEPTGMQWIADELLHTIIPVYFFIYWFIYVTKRDLKTTSVYRWLIYPIIYLAAVLINGYFTRYYPYPFINVPEIGVRKVTMNIFSIAFFIILLKAILIFIGRISLKQKEIK